MPVPEGSRIKEPWNFRVDFLNSRKLSRFKGLPFSLWTDPLAQIQDPSGEVQFPSSKTNSEG